ncbi:MAG: hypothetical protein ABJN98_00220, partial [Roseibium sp.]
ESLPLALVMYSTSRSWGHYPLSVRLWPNYGSVPVWKIRTQCAALQNRMSPCFASKNQYRFKAKMKTGIISGFSGLNHEY